MSPLLLLLSIACSAEPETDRLPAAAPAQSAFHEYHRQLSDLFKQESDAKDAATRRAAVQALCDLHRELVRDPRYATSPVLKEYRARVWSRLSKIKTELKQQLARQGKRQALDDLAALEIASPEELAVADSLGASLTLLDQTQGGPGYLLARGGGPLPADFGADLVALIERTINPNFWDVVGGPGSIVYYAPLQCLVVRATAEVHEKIGGVVGDVRAAGR